MKRWLSMILMAAVLLSALTVGAFAADDPIEDGDERTLENGLVLKKLSGVDGWTVISGQNCRGNVIIPATYEGLDVVAIGGINEDDPEKKPFEAFRTKTGVTGITIPETVTKIGETAFANTGLESLVIHNRMEEIGKEAFQQCTSLRSVTFSDNTDVTHTLEIKENAFQFCTGLEVADFPQHKTIIGDEAFLLCQGLKDVFIWNGSIGAQSFAKCGNLTRVAIAKGVTPIDSTAFGEVPAPVAPPDPDHPDDPYDKYPTLPVIHYEGDTNPITGWPSEKLHLNTFMRKAVTNATCIDPGKFSRYIECGEAGCVLSGNGAINDGDKQLPALGHNYVKPDNYDELLKKEIQDNGYKDCEEFDWEYEMICSRSGCSEKESVTEHVEARAEHQWGDEPEDDATEETDERITKIEPSTCKGPGKIIWKAKCGVCGVEDNAEKELPELPEGQHTYYDKNTVTTTEVEAACAYQGVVVTYLTCDGDHGQDGLKPCVFGDGGTNKCSDLLEAIDQAKAALEAATAAAHDDPADGGDGSPVTPPAPADPVEAARKALIEAVNAYVTHLGTDHKRLGEAGASPDECVAKVERVNAEGDDHVGPITVVEEKLTSNGGAYDCTLGGTKTTVSICGYCGEEFTKTENLAPTDHNIPDTVQTEILPANCTQPKRIKYLEDTKCTVCGFEIKAGTEVNIVGEKPDGHKWEDFQQTEILKEPTCAPGKAVGTATCSVCGEVEELEIELAPIANHTWGPWIKSEDGKEETRTCSVCGETQTNILTPEDPEDPDDPDNPDNPDNPDDPDKPDPNADYTITVVQGAGGTATASRTTAKAGNSITITVSPNSGYELDMVRVIAGGTSVVSTSNQGGGRYTFTMPANNVNVTVSFERTDSGTGWGGTSSADHSDPRRTEDAVPVQITSPASVPRTSASNQLFSDIPTNHWAAGEISWVNDMGYMSGTNGRFNPDGAITTQQVWMVLARLMGSNPTNMSEAWRWAVNSGFAVGGDPYTPMQRHQVITALYRCAVLKGRATRPSGLTLAGYADSRLVPTVAQDAMIWAVSAGIVTGDSSNRLNPTSTVTRAQFAVFLYRFNLRA